PGVVEGHRDPPRPWCVVGVQPAEPVTQLVFLVPLLGAPPAHAHAAGAESRDPFPPHLPQLCPCHATTPPCRLMARLSGRPGAATRWCGFDVYSRSRASGYRSEEHTSELQSRENIVCRLLLEKKINLD